MRNFTLIRGEWRRGADRIHCATVRTLHTRGACRLWIPITPETADALGWGPKATAKHWPRFRFNTGVFHKGEYLGPRLLVEVDPCHAGDAPPIFRLYPSIPKTYEVIGAAPRKGAQSGWCWEVRPRVSE